MPACGRAAPHDRSVAIYGLHRCRARARGGGGINQRLFQNRGHNCLDAGLCQVVLILNLSFYISILGWMQKEASRRGGHVSGALGAPMRTHLQGLCPVFYS